MPKPRPHVPFSPEDLDGHMVLERKTALPPKAREEPTDRGNNLLFHPRMGSQGFGVLAIAAVIVLLVLFLLSLLGVRF